MANHVGSLQEESTLLHDKHVIGRMRFNRSEDSFFNLRYDLNREIKEKRIRMGKLNQSFYLKSIEKCQLYKKRLFFHIINSLLIANKLSMSSSWPFTMNKWVQSLHPVRN